MQNKVPMLLTIADLSKRWDMFHQSIHERIKYREFPSPIQYVSNGGTALFTLNDIEEFERTHKWIQTPGQREAKQRFIFNLISSENYRPK